MRPATVWWRPAASRPVRGGTGRRQQPATQHMIDLLNNGLSLFVAIGSILRGISGRNGVRTARSQRLKRRCLEISKAETQSDRGIDVVALEKAESQSAIHS